MTLKRTPLKPTRTVQTRAKALAAIEHAILDAAQKASAENFDFVIEGAQTRTFGEKHEIVIRLAPWGECP